MMDNFFDRPKYERYEQLKKLYPGIVIVDSDDYDIPLFGDCDLIIRILCCDYNKEEVRYKFYNMFQGHYMCYSAHISVVNTENTKENYSELLEEYNRRQTITSPVCPHCKKELILKINVNETKTKLYTITGGVLKDAVTDKKIDCSTGAYCSECGKEVIPAGIVCDEDTVGKYLLGENK